MSLESTRRRLIRANPVPDHDQLNAEPGQSQEFLLALKERTGITIPRRPGPAKERTPHPGERVRPTKEVYRGRQRRLGGLIAAAAFTLTLAVGFGIFALVNSNDGGVVTSPSGVDADIALVHQVYADLSAGNLDLALARIDTDRLQRLRERWEYGAGLGVTYEVSQCTAASQQSATLVSCNIAPQHPVFDTLGITAFLQAHTVSEGRIVEGASLGLASQLEATVAVYLFALELEPAATEAVCGAQGANIGLDDFWNAQCGEHLSGFVDRFVASRQTEN